jgi:hypothetical protein
MTPGRAARARSQAKEDRPMFQIRAIDMVPERI